jgi:V-type H+-transporting ATPase subunit a
VIIISSAGERHRDGVLQGIAAALEAWILQVKREKAVYHTLNKCRRALAAHPWLSPPSG